MNQAPEQALADTAQPRRTSTLIERPLRMKYRNELLVLLALAVVLWLLPGSVPPGMYALGAVSAAVLTLNAIGIALVYRSNRIINFAQVAPGVAAALIFSSLVRFKPILHWLDTPRVLCNGSCVDSEVLTVANYWFSLVLCLGLAVGMAWIGARVIRAFADAPRLIFTIGTVFLGPVLVGLASALATGVLVPSPYKTGELAYPPSTTLRLPLRGTFELRPQIFHITDIVVVVAAVAAVIVLVGFLRSSTTGMAIRAAAEDPKRAETLGIDVAAVTTRVWLIAGFLSGVAALLVATSSGADSLSAEIAIEDLIRVLAVVVVARMVNLPLIGVAALVLSVLQHASELAYQSVVPFQASLFVLIGVVLFLQTSTVSRAEQAAAGSWRAIREVRPIPRELRGLPTVRKWIRIGSIAAAVVLVGFPWLATPAQNSLASYAFAYLIVSYSVLVLTGWAGQISLGQFGLAAVGAYVAVVSGLPFPFALAAGTIAGGVVALAIGLPALRLRGLHLAIMTLAFHLAVVAVLLNARYLGKHLPTDVRRPFLLGIDFSDGRVFYYFMLLAAAATGMAVLGLRRSRLGRVLIAARDNDQAAASFGISLTRARLGAFATSGMIAAAGGALLAYQQLGVNVGVFDPEQSFDVFLTTVIGGLGAVAGPVIGTVWAMFPSFLNLPGLIEVLTTSLGGLLLLLLLRGGLGQAVYDYRDELLRRLARRHHILVPSLLADATKQEMGWERASITPKLLPGGQSVYVPKRYALDDQWGIDPDLGASDPLVSGGRRG